MHYHDEHDDTDELSAICVTCAKVFTLDEIDEHYAARFRCAVCCYTSQQLHDWCRHNWVHSALQRYKCPVCDLATNQKSNLIRHIKNQHLVGVEYE